MKEKKRKNKWSLLIFQNMSEKPELEVLEETEIKTSKEHQIILYNDEINTFDHVISCLIIYVTKLKNRQNSAHILSIITENVLSKLELLKI